MENEQLGYKKSKIEFIGVTFILKDGTEMTVKNENKDYFTPDIEDIRIGYECEIIDPYTGNWTNYKFKLQEVYGEDNCLVLNFVYRVSYLTKEQIEAEGWISNGKDIPTLKKGVYTIWFSSYKFLRIFEEQCSESFPLYTGEVKSINEFRYICKLLKIN